MKQLHLVIDGLGAESLAGHRHLARLVARGRSEATEAGCSVALAHLFGLDTRDLAAIALAAEGADPGGEAWFRADPVHLLAGMHSLTLFDSRHFQIDADESSAMVAALNRHFEGEIEFRAPHPTRWYARFRRTPEVDIPPLDQIAGRLIAPDQIAGPGARELQRATMEVQMLLHDHPVNEAREGRNEATVNSLWLWGGARFRRPEARFDRVMADDFQARALATAAGSQAMPLPARLDRLPDGRTLALLDRPPDDPDWFAPVLRGLQWGHLDAVELTLAGTPATRCVIGRWQALRFWR